MASPTAQPLPPAFDPGFYRAHNPDLALADDAAAVAHYEARGRAEGRVASPFARREALVAAIDAARPVLEIGPFCAPLLAGVGVEYLDRLDAAGLRGRALTLGLDTSACPERIHHVGGLDAVAPDTFDAVLASHSIEHQPDLIRHLEEVARVLRANGRYWLVVPDKRFCFDHFLPESGIADVLDAFEEERARHRLASVVEHVALTTHNDPARHWRGEHGGVDEAERRRRAAEALTAYRRSDGDYLDVHAWQFTPASFAALLGTLARLGLSSFEVEQVYDTPRDRAEFCAVLRRARPARRAARRRHGQAIAVLQTAEPFREARLLAVTAPNMTEYCRRHGIAYESVVGAGPGFPLMLEALAARGFAGWAACLNADAYARDLDFDLPGYLSARAGRAAIFVGDIAFVNLGHPLGRRLADALRGARAGDDWLDIAHGEAGLADAILIEPVGTPIGFVAGPSPRDDMHDRLATLRDEVAAVARAAGIADPDAPRRGGRAAARLLHPIEGDPWLAEAPPGTSSDVGMLGRAAAGRGLLGGDRQHRRCAEDPAFAHERALRTHDALLSLAELTGAIGIESPDLGTWGATRRIAAPALFMGVERALGADLAPPATIGAYLGIEVGRGLVLHARMIEAIHTAWRAGQLAALFGGRVAELGGGIGLAAWYARRLGLADYRLVAPRALQPAVLADLEPPVPLDASIAAPLDLLVAEDLADGPEDEALRHLADATAHGARAILSIGHDAAADPAQPRLAVAELLARVGGWRRIGRARHGLRPGYHEEIFQRAPPVASPLTHN